MIWIASCLYYYEGETLLGAYTTRQAAIDSCKRDKTKSHYADEWVVYELPINANWTTPHATVWSSKEDK